MLEKDILEVLLSEEQINQKTRELGALLTEEYKDQYPLAIGILKVQCLSCLI